MPRLSASLLFISVFHVVASAAIGADVSGTGEPNSMLKPSPAAVGPQTLAEQAAVAEKTGDFKTAMALRVRARREFNAQAPKVWNSKSAKPVCDNLLLLGADYQKLGQLSNCITVFNESLRILDKTDTKDIVPMVKARLAYADSLSAQGEHRQALPLYQQALVGLYEQPKEKGSLLYREAVLKTSLCYGRQGLFDQGANALKELVWLPGGDRETRNREIKTLVMFLKRLHRDLEASVYEQKLQ